MKTYFIGLLLTLNLVSCGKEAQNNAGTINRAPVVEELSKRVLTSLSKEMLSCRASRCPEYLSKITIFDGENKIVCPGILVQNNKVVTSSTCLPRRMRASGLSCESNVVISFFNKKKTKPENYLCDKVLYSTKQKFSSATLWDEDIAVVRLKRKVSHNPVRISYRGLKAYNSFYSWNLKKKSEFNHGFSKKKCERILNSYSNPFANVPESSFQVLSNCSSEKASRDDRTGSLLVSKGQLVGIKSESVESSLIKSLERAGLLKANVNELSFATNIACTQSRFLSRRTNSSHCFSQKSYFELDRRRYKLLVDKDLHKETMVELSKELSKSEKYFRWNFDFISSRAGNSYESFMTKPECFFNIKSWIREFKKGRSYRTRGTVKVEKKSYSIFTKLDENLRAVSIFSENEQKIYKVQFNPHDAYFYDKTYVKLSSRLMGKPKAVRFEGIKPCK